MVLDRFHECRDQGAAEVGVFAGKGLEATPGQPHAHHLNVRAQQHIRSLRRKLLRDGVGVAPRGLGGEAGGHAQQRGILRGFSRELAIRVVALRAIVHRQRHDAVRHPRVAVLAAHADEAGVAMPVGGPTVVLTMEHVDLLREGHVTHDLLRVENRTVPDEVDAQHLATPRLRVRVVGVQPGVARRPACRPERVFLVAQVRGVRAAPRL
mmetsp:Transcript_123536/g.357212  ORF Transcript_123536/g.357212 Transcript_123536/m.357212 type:complete len:209 (+) Transcript_123536:1758-2384(+)